MVPHAVKHLRVCGQNMPVRWYLSVFHYKHDIAQVCVVVQLHDAVQHLGFAGGLLVLRRGLPPEYLHCSAHEVTCDGDGLLPWDAKATPHYHHAVLQGDEPPS